jgi:hypothetical protein
MPALLDSPRPSLLDEPRHTVPEAARLCGVHASVIYRWAQKGVGGVRLPLTRIGGKTYVLRRHLEEFIRARSDQPADDGRADAAARAEAAGHELDAAGL